MIKVLQRYRTPSVGLSASLRGILILEILLIGQLLMTGVALANHVVPCKSYFNFLTYKGVKNPNLESCDAFSRYLISSSQLNDLDFFTGYKALAAEKHAFYKLADYMIDEAKKITQNIYLKIEVLESEIDSLFFQLQDEDRRKMYVYLLKSKKFKIVQKNIKAGSFILDEFHFQEPSRFLENIDLRYLDRKSSDAILLCLLRVDNFLEELETILASNKVKSCLSAN